LPNASLSLSLSLLCVFRTDSSELLMIPCTTQQHKQTTKQTNKIEKNTHKTPTKHPRLKSFILNAC
jgi:hypothetical protein